MNRGKYHRPAPSFAPSLVGDSRTLGSLSRSTMPRSMASFGALSPSEHDELLAILKAALLAGSDTDSMSAPGGGGGGLQNVGTNDWLKQKAAEAALLSKVSTTSTAKLTQASRVSSYLAAANAPPKTQAQLETEAGMRALPGGAAMIAELPWNKPYGRT